MADQYGRGGEVRAVRLGFGIAVVGALLVGVSALAHDADALDVRAVGLPWYWLVLGFGGQALFMSRMALQWWASERMRSSVVPEGFWWLSLAGAAVLLVYFVRRGDPVGLAGQLFGFVVYARNLILIHRKPDGETH